MAAPWMPKTLSEGSRAVLAVMAIQTASVRAATIRRLQLSNPVAVMAMVKAAQANEQASGTVAAKALAAPVVHRRLEKE